MRDALIDITRPLDAHLAMWPGDTAYRLERVLRMADGAAVNLGAATLSLHAGTHVDAPFHFDDAGPHVADLPLEAYAGPAWVLDVRDAIRGAGAGGGGGSRGGGGGEIPWDPFAALDLARFPRLLLRTGGWPDDRRFPDQVATLAPDVPARLGAAGVRLVGFDVPSVDALDSKQLPIHHALHTAGILILESLRLDHVSPGPYELWAFPLRIVGADGSPVRAVLRRFQNG